MARAAESGIDEVGDRAVLRVLIVDDHPMFRMGLSAALADMDGIELVGEAERAEEVEPLVEATRPDVVLLDVRLPDGSGLEINRRLAEHHPQVKVILLTMSEDHDTVLTALRDGARGYLVKGTGPGPRRARAAGGRRRRRGAQPGAGPLGERAGRRPVPRHPQPPFPALTDRELDILELIAQGLDNQTIARRLVLSPKTVRNHVSNVFAKVHANDRSQAIVLARQAGLGRGRPERGRRWPSAALEDDDRDDPVGGLGLLDVLVVGRPLRGHDRPDGGPLVGRGGAGGDVEHLAHHLDADSRGGRRGSCTRPGPPARRPWRRRARRRRRTRRR